MTQLRSKLTKALSLLALLGAAAAHADWRIAADSRVSYVSLKNNQVAENNHFMTVTGSLSDDGKINAVVDLSSVETGVDIRNERMRTLFFEIADFPKATVSGVLPPTAQKQLASGEAVRLELPLDLSLHGQTATFTAHLWALQADDQLFVHSIEPLLLSAKTFGLEAGVEALRSIAGLNAIAATVPVLLDLTLHATN